MLTGRSGQFNLHTSVYVLIGRWQGPVTTDRTRPVSGDRTLPAFGQHIITGMRVELTGASGHPAEAHNGLFFRLPYK